MTNQPTKFILYKTDNDQIKVDVLIKDNFMNKIGISDFLHFKRII